MFARQQVHTHPALRGRRMSSKLTLKSSFPLLGRTFIFMDIIIIDNVQCITCVSRCFCCPD